jgi:hypothetical protein
MSAAATPPALSWVLSIEVTLGPEQMLGRVETGERIDYPITGGRFEGVDPDGRPFEGQVVAGGADYFLMRDDGIGVLDAAYQLAAADGSVIDIRNRGLWVPNQVGLTRLAAGGEPLPEELYCRCSPVFCAPPGAHDWLNRHVFTGSVTYPRARIVRVHCWLVR